MTIFTAYFAENESLYISFTRLAGLYMEKRRSHKCSGRCQAFTGKTPGKIGGFGLFAEGGSYVEDTNPGCSKIVGD